MADSLVVVPDACAAALAADTGRHFSRPTLADVATSSYFEAMRAVGVKVLKDKLSEYVRLAAGGEPVLVTDRDRVVAELGPPHAGRAIAVADALLAEAVREGWLTPPLMAGGDPPPRAPVATWSEIATGLAQDRAER